MLGLCGEMYTVSKRKCAAHDDHCSFTSRTAFRSSLETSLRACRMISLGRCIFASVSTIDEDLAGDGGGKEDERAR